MRTIGRESRQKHKKLGGGHCEEDLEMDVCILRLFQFNI